MGEGVERDHKLVHSAPCSSGGRFPPHPEETHPAKRPLVATDKRRAAHTLEQDVKLAMTMANTQRQRRGMPALPRAGVGSARSYAGAAGAQVPRRALAPLQPTLDSVASISPSSTVVLPKRPFAGEAKDELAVQGLK